MIQIIVFVLCLVGNSFGATILKHTYTQTEITTNDDMTMNLVIYTLDLDINVYINDTELPDLSLEPVDLGGGEGLPASMFDQMGAITLRCPCDDCGSGDFTECGPSECVYPSTPSFGEGAPKSLMPLPAVEEPAYILFSVLGGVNVSTLNLVPAPKRIMVAKINKYLDPTTNTWTHIVPEEIDLSNCTLEFIGPESTGSHYVNATGSPLAPLETSGAFEEVERVCNYTEYQEIADALMGEIANLATLTDAESIRGKTWALTAYMARDAWISCTKLATDLLVYGTTNKTISGDRGCHHPYGNEDWLADPCCNWRLSWEQCCIPKEHTVEIETVTGFNQDEMVAQCQNPAKASLVLSQYVINSQRAEQCEDQIKRHGYDPNMWDTIMRFVTDCNEDVFGISGQAPTCKTNEDCWTSCDTVSGQCIVPWNDPEEPLINCFVASMDPEMERFLRKRWGLTIFSNESEFLAAFRENMMDEGCKGPTSWQFNDRWEQQEVESCDLGDHNCGCQGELCVKNTFIPANETACLASEACNWNSYPPAVNETQCESKAPGSFCGDCSGGCWDKTVLSKCSITWITPELCSVLEGTSPSWNPMWCTYAEGGPASDCISDRLCAPKDPGADPNYDWCSSSCYIADMDEDGCLTLRNDTFLTEWDTNLRDNTTGVCRLPQYWSKELCTTQVHENATWLYSRQWERGWFDTESTCDTGECTLGPRISEDECLNTSACSYNCRVCESKVYKQSMCFRNNTTSGQCATLGGYYTENLCTFEWITGQAACVAAGHTYETCGSLDEDLDACMSCQNADEDCPIRSNAVLQCRVNPWGQCKTQEKCEASGFCDDWEYSNWNSEYCRNPDNSGTLNCTGACFFNYTYDLNGNPKCDNDAGFSWGRMGCILTNTTDPSECQNMGGEWKTRAYTKSACLAHGNGCYEKRFWGMTQKDEETCVTCDGSYKPYYRWTPGQWRKGSMRTLTWSDRAWGSVNTWSLTLNWTKMNEVFNDLVAVTMAKQIETQYKCKIGLVATNVKTLACDCGDEPGEDCYSTSPQLTRLNSLELFSSLSKTSEVSNIYLRTSEGSVPSTTDSLPLDIYVANDLSYLVEVPVGRSRGLGIPLFVGASPEYTIYEVVENSHGAIVGQIVGAGVYLNFTGGELDDPAYVCITQDDDITVLDTYTVADFGYTDNETDIIMPMGGEAVVSGGQLCFNITSSSFYYPIYRLDDWEDVLPSNDTTSTTSPPPPGSSNKTISTVLIVLSVLFFVSIIAAVVILAWFALRGNANPGFDKLS